MGIHRGPRGSARIGCKNLVGLPHQPDRRTDFPDRPNHSLLPSPPKREAEQLIEAAEKRGLSTQTFVGQPDYEIGNWSRSGGRLRPPGAIVGNSHAKVRALAD